MEFVLRRALTRRAEKRAGGAVAPDGLDDVQHLEGLFQVYQGIQFSPDFLALALGREHGRESLPAFVEEPCGLCPEARPVVAPVFQDVVPDLSFHQGAVYEEHVDVPRGLLAVGNGRSMRSENPCGREPSATIPTYSRWLDESTLRQGCGSTWYGRRNVPARPPSGRRRRDACNPGRAYPPS